MRTHTAPARIIEDAKAAVMRTSPVNGRAQGGLLATQVDTQLAGVRTSAAQIAGFALVGLLLAITGLYGVLSYVVQQRTQEIGIRGVLGAGPGRILGLVLSQAMRLAIVGVVVGLVTALLTMRLMQGLLYGTPTSDPMVYAVVTVTTLGVALVASYFPARRAAGVDPLIALRAP
jgi:ABC-type antimicrobial peptide transport system permease subunit